MLPDPRIPIIAVDGGPCGGKTTFQAIVRERLASVGWRVFFTREVATDVFQSGIDIEEMLADPARYYRFQRAMLREQLRREEAALEFAELIPGGQTLVMTDRGGLSNGGYIGAEEFEAILHDEGLTMEQLRNGRYAGVIHLVSAAKGAVEFYNLDNPHRVEADPAVAAELDDKIRDAWTGCRGLHILVNEEVDGRGERRQVSFDEKMNRAVQHVFRILGLPAPGIRERRFLLGGLPDDLHLPVTSVEQEIDQVYLHEEDRSIERRLRRIREPGAGSVATALYTYAEKRPGPNGTRVRRERGIKGSEYALLQTEADPRFGRVVKRRTSFVWRDQYYRLDRFVSPGGLALLEVDQPENGGGLPLPDFLPVEREVTHESRYSNRELARSVGGRS